MFKLIKYEFRKARVPFLIMLGITVVLQLMFQYGLMQLNDVVAHTRNATTINSDKLGPLIISTALLPLAGISCAFFVLISGITSYSRELKSHQGYLTFLTPNSTVKIVASKFLYTFVNALLFFGLYGALAFLDVMQVLPLFSSYRNMAELINELVAGYGIYLKEIGLYALFYLLYFFIMSLGVIAVAYVSITISATLLRDKGWRWIVSLLIFIAITRALGYIDDFLLNGLDTVKIIDPDMTGRAAGIGVDVLGTILVPAMVGTGLLRLVVIIASLFGCSYMLDMKIDL